MKFLGENGLKIKTKAKKRLVKGIRLFNFLNMLCLIPHRSGRY